jgi:hypothetical protein
MPSPAITPSPALARFVTGGLLDTVESFRLGTLPLHRFAWELRTRIDSLAGLMPSTRTLTRLRWLERDVARLHATLVAAGRTELTADELAGLGATLAGLRTVLATLTPHDPLDPSGAGRPAARSATATGAARQATARASATAATGQATAATPVTAPAA